VSAPLSADQRQIIIEAIRSGATVTAAAGAAGCSRRTIARWRERGAGDGATPSEREFLLDYERAEAVAEVRLVQAITSASALDWRAAAWMLCHRWPDRWSEKRTIKIEGEHTDGAAMVVEMLRQVREDRRADELSEEGRL
jgi:transposase-like protein